MPAPSDADRPRLYREVEALRLHNQLDPKRFYRKDDGEGKGVSGLPKFFAVRYFILFRRKVSRLICVLFIDGYHRSRKDAVRRCKL